MAFNSRNFAEYLQFTLNTDSEDRVLAFPEGEQAQSGFKYYTRADLRRLSNKAAAYYISHGVPVRQRGQRPLVITLFGYGTIEWAASYYAIIRLGHSVVSLSSRLSEAYVAGLLAKSKTDILVRGRPVNVSNASIPVITLPGEHDIESQPLKPEATVTCDVSIIDPEDIAYYCHSSGSTSLPKLFPVGHGEWVFRLSLCEKIITAGESTWWASAMYNAVGLISISLAPNKSVPVYFENDRRQFTVQGALNFANEANPSVIGMTPWTLAMIASVPAGVEALKRANNVIIFGAVCSDDLGDKLVSQGVKMCSFYAMTEAGSLATSGMRPPGDDEWQWVEIVPNKKKFIDMRPLDESQELWKMWCLPQCPEILPAVQDKDGYFCTGDLFLKHPTKEGRWKVVGRQDDQIKIYQKDRQSIVNAITYEQKIFTGNDDVVDEIVLFGQGRGSLGVLVFSENVAEGSAKRAEAERRVWDTIQAEVNGKLPTSIDRNMIVIVDTDRVSLPQTGKFNLIRPQVYLKFQDLIERAYDNQALVPPPKTTPQRNGLYRTTSCGAEDSKDLTSGQSARYVE